MNEIARGLLFSIETGFAGTEHVKRARAALEAYIEQLETSQNAVDALRFAARRVLELEGKATCAYPTAEDAGAFYRALSALRDLIGSGT